mgnify:FL=1
MIKKLVKNKNHNVFLLDRSSNKKKISTLNIKSKNLKIIKGDFRIYKSLNLLIKKKNINTIFHLGAITQVIDAYKSPVETYECNITGTINILEAMRNNNKNINLIYSSSDKAYGELRNKE